MAYKDVGSSVGRQPAANAAKDQEIVQSLLNAIPEWAGGTEGSLKHRPVAGVISEELQDGINRFQDFNVWGPNRDGRISPGGETIQTLNRLAARTWLPYYTVPFVPLYGQRDMKELPEAVGENACWWACIKMVVHTHGGAALIPPQELVNSRPAVNNMQLECIYPRYRLYAIRGGYKTDWTGAELVQTLKEAGPLIAYGRFQTDPAATDTGLQHAIVVYGVHRGEMVRYNDPWQPKTSLMAIFDFNARLHYGHFSLAAYRDA